MNNIVCIYPQDFTTSFLKPLCEHICKTFGAKEVGYDTSLDDDPLEIIYNVIKDAQIIFFLGHGKSSALYASTIDNVELFNQNNVNLLENKRLFLLACNSNQFIPKFGLTKAIGFGYLPTSEDDVRNRKEFHNLDISKTTICDVDYFNNALVQCMEKTLTIETLDDQYLFKERMLFNISREIVKCLLNKRTPNYRIVADELYYVYKDMVIR